MRRRVSFLISLAALIVLALVIIGLRFVGDGRDAHVFAGKYQWTGGSGKLTMTLRPSGEQAWDVDFTFVTGGKDVETWYGSANGSIDDGGTVQGTVSWDIRTYDFTATVVDGVMSGQHRGTVRGNSYDTGTFEVTRVADPSAARLEPPEEAERPRPRSRPEMEE